MARYKLDLPRCPTCNIVLGVVPRDGRLDAICSRCRFKYRVLSGTLAPPLGEGGFRLNLPSGMVEGVALAVRETAVGAWIQARSGHSVSVVHTMRGARLEELVAVHDQEEGSFFKVDSPGWRARTIGMMVAAVSFITALWLLGASGLGYALSFGGAAAASSAAFAVAYKLKKPTQLLSREEQSRLSQVQDVLTRIDPLQQSWEAAVLDRAIKVWQANRLVELAAKMRSVDAKLYSPRLIRLGKVLEMLQRQMTLDDELANGYEKAIDMLEIEIESLDVALVIGDDAMAMIDGKVEEVAALKRMHTELEAQLAGYEEVERYLGRSGQGKALNSQASGRELANLPDAPPIPLEDLFEPETNDPD